jgi:hypothetical protein
MQLDYLGKYEKEKNRFDLSLGLQGRRSKASAPPEEKFQDRIVLRKISYSYRKKEGFEASVGRDSLPMGIATEDHTAFLRARLRRGINDYVSKVQLDRWEETHNYSLFAFAPSFEELERNREYGVGSRYEHAVFGNSTLGVSTLAGMSEAIRRGLFSAFTRFTPHENIAILAEHALLRRWVRAASDTKGFDQQISFLKAAFFPLEYLELALVGELLHVEAPFAEKKRQFGPSLQTRLHKNISFLADARRIQTPGRTREDRFAFQFYGHW